MRSYPTLHRLGGTVQTTAAVLFVGGLALTWHLATSPGDGVLAVVAFALVTVAAVALYAWGELLQVAASAAEDLSRLVEPQAVPPRVATAPPTGPPPPPLEALRR